MLFFTLGSGLGIVLAGGRDNQHVPGDNGIFVTKIIPGSPAHNDGTITVGDRLVEVLTLIIHDCIGKSCLRKSCNEIFLCKSFGRRNLIPKRNIL